MKGAEMPKVTNKQAGDFIAKGKPFEANSMRGALDTDGEYRVYSYSTLMATVKGGRITYLNNQRYSVTTSKHQGIIRGGLRGFTLSPDAEVLER